MGYAIPVKIYEKLEEKLGRETASIITEAFEASIKEAIKDGRSELKAEISEELKKELATKYDIEVLRKEIEMIRLEFKKDLKIVTIILLAVIVFLNQNSLEFIARILGLLK